MKWLGLGASDQPAANSDTDAVRRIVEKLDRLDPERARYIAAFAYLLARVALSDRVFEAGEVAAMERIVAEHGALPEDQAVLVVQIAKSQNALFGATENFLVSREFGRVADTAQKIALLDALFAVSAASGGISVIEDNEIRRITDELLLGHGDFIAVRSRYRDRLNVLRRQGS